ncbi:hypothetical protein [Rhodococcus rhodochrous]|uniref:hypothetical protein n=1 Tax=Rhodococcus rhodochrous TaxID=1829 RepID=UPI001E32EB48|nr:hypothetical protein [Rhodococcus rhodochrous]
MESMHSENMRYTIVFGRLSGHALLDGQGGSRYERFLAIREALRGGFDTEALLHAKINPGIRGSIVLMASIGRCW